MVVTTLGSHGCSKGGEKWQAVPLLILQAVFIKLKRLGARRGTSDQLNHIHAPNPAKNTRPSSGGQRVPLDRERVDQSVLDLDTMPGST